MDFQALQNLLFSYVLTKTILIIAKRYLKWILVKVNPRNVLLRH